MGQYSLIRGRALRVTRTNGCGVPALGPDSTLVTKGFISVGLNSNTDAGTTVTVTNANGENCVNDVPVPRLLNITTEIALCGVDVELVSMLTSQPLVLNAAGTEVVGFALDTKVEVDLSGFALELWTAIVSDECEDGVEAEYGYLLLPFLKGGTLGNLTVQNGSVDFTITGATTRNGTGWGVGPYDVTRDEDGNEGPLNVALTSGRHLHMEVVSVAPPAPTDGAAALGVPAVGATAGTPGTTTPAQSYAPADFAALTADPLTATPNTAWTTGQSIVLRDGSRANWNGTAWEAGVA